jgi:hypothetical protein
MECAKWKVICVVTQGGVCRQYRGGLHKFKLPGRAEKETRREKTPYPLYAGDARQVKSKSRSNGTCRMTETTTLHIAEIPYDSGSVQYRYSRRLSPDGQRWIRHGRFESFAENGTLLSEGHYIDGKEDGWWKDSHPNGQLAAEGRYEQGSEVGIWKYWSIDGLEEAGH